MAKLINMHENEKIDELQGKLDAHNDAEKKALAKMDELEEYNYCEKMNDIVHDFAAFLLTKISKVTQDKIPENYFEPEVLDAIGILAQDSFENKTVSFWVRKYMRGEVDLHNMLINLSHELCLQVEAAKPKSIIDDDDGENYCDYCNDRY